MNQRARREAQGRRGEALAALYLRLKGWRLLAGRYKTPVGEVDLVMRKGAVTAFIEAIETAKCFEEGVITSAAAANIGSIMGIGFPALTGGAAQFMTGWQALDETGHGVGPIGLDAFLARADELADAYGERFRPTAYLRELAAKGEGFPA